MFGYIIINKAEMKFREYEVYHSYYCGLCRKLSDKYGVTGQMSLSYDMTFLLMLLTGLYDPETETGQLRCIAHPLEKHTYRTNLFTEYFADMNVLLTEYKCRDDWEDERKITRLLYGKILAGKSNKYKKLYGEKIGRIARLMRDYTLAEREGRNDVDTMAGLFGKVMAEIVRVREDEWSGNLYRLGFFLGKFIYLCDAYEDVEEDIKKGNFNPLKQRFGRPEFEEECKTILTMMMSECCREFEQLPILDNVEILRNILYSGVWGRYELAHAKRMKAQEEQQKNTKNKN